MKLLVLSNHLYGLRGRKASVHFITDEYARRGADVSFVTVGRSLLTRLRRHGRYVALNAAPERIWARTENGVNTVVTSSALHPIDLRRPLLNALTEPLVSGFGRALPDDVIRPLAGVDRIMIDSGTAVMYFPYVRRQFPDAKIFYNAADLLRNINRRPSLLRAEAAAARAAAVVRAPSALMAEGYPTEANFRFIPHGLDKALFDACATSPYPQGSTNLVSVGSTLHDAEALRAIALAVPDAIVHVFGAPNDAEAPANMVQYGERPFGDIIPYIKYADAGIAAYVLDDDTAYMAQSSLKLIQYRYCGLPILAPTRLSGANPNVITYDPQDAGSIRQATQEALASGGGAYAPEDILSWSQVVDRLEQALG